MPIAITVPRSGSSRMSPAKSPAVRPIGLASSFSVRGAGRRARYAAAQIARLSFASSEGWKLSEPTPSQRRAPFTSWPSTSTAAQSPRLVSISTGAR